MIWCVSPYNCLTYQKATYQCHWMHSPRFSWSQSGWMVLGDKSTFHEDCDTRCFVLGSGRDVFFSKLPLTHQKNSLLPTSCWFWMTFSPQNGFGHPNAIGSVHELLHQIVAGRDGILVIEPGRYAVAPSSLVNKKVPCWKKGDVNELFCWLATFLAQNTKILFWLCRLFFLPPWNKQYSQISFEFVFLQKRFCPLQTPWSSHHWLSPSSWGLPTGEVNFKSTQRSHVFEATFFSVSYLIGIPKSLSQSYMWDMKVIYMFWGQISGNREECVLQFHHSTYCNFVPLPKYKGT